MDEPGLEALGVLGGHADAVGDRPAQHHRHRDLAAAHVAPLGGVVGDLVHGQRHEVEDLQLDDGPAADERPADAAAGDGGLGDRRVDHPLRAEAPRAAAVTPNRPPCMPMSSPITKTPGSRCHLLAQRLVQGLGHRQLACGRLGGGVSASRSCQPSSRRSTAPARRRRQRGGGVRHGAVPGRTAPPPRSRRRPRPGPAPAGARRRRRARRCRRVARVVMGSFCLPVVDQLGGAGLGGGGARSAGGRGRSWPRSASAPRRARARSTACSATGADGLHVVAVDHHAGEAVALGPDGQVRHRDGPLDRHRDRPLVVLTHEHRRGLQHRRQVAGLVHDALVGGPIAEEARPSPSPGPTAAAHGPRPRPWPRSRPRSHRPPASRALMAVMCIEPPLPPQ